MENSSIFLEIDSTVRLVNGTSPNEGRVELFHEGKWGTVCDDDWDIEDANVVCKMLGYPSALRVSRLMEFGEGTGKIILDDVNCSGSEKNIAECPHEGLYSNNCFHREDAGVVCNSGNTCGVKIIHFILSCYSKSYVNETFQIRFF